MFCKLESNQYRKINEIINNSGEECLFAYAILENNIPGSVYVDDLANPRTSLICSSSGKYLIAGDDQNDEFNKEISEFLKENTNHNGYYDLYASSNKWIEILSEMLKGHVVRLKHSIYSHDISKNFSNVCDKPLIEGFELKQIDEEIFEKASKLFTLTSKDHFGSAKEFNSKNFGYCITDDNQIASIVASCYKGNGYAEIDIYTRPEFQRKVLAFAICSEFLKHCKTNNLTALWICDYGNENSNNLAAKLGFEKVKDIEIFWWHSNKEFIAKYLEDFKY
jgi:RimJ/RimL family protein N-acetyltransferase